MLSVEECMELLDVDILCFEEFMLIDSNANTLDIPTMGISLALNESQKRLMVCLIKKINAKRDIINIVWYENHQRISDNNYHQLTFQLRALLQRSGLPANLLVTIPYYGLKLNESLWRTIVKESHAEPAVPQNESSTPADGNQDTNVPEDKEEAKKHPAHTPPYIFMFSFFMLSLAVYWLK